MATLTRIALVLVQFALASAVLHHAAGVFERASEPFAGTAGEPRAHDGTVARGDPMWLALARVPLPPGVGARPAPSTKEGTAWL